MSNKLLNMHILLRLSLLLVMLAFVVLGAKVESLSLEEAMHQTKRPRCGLTCLFRFCQTNLNLTFSPAGRRLVMRDPDSAANPFMCRTDGTAGRIIRVGEARIQEDEDTLTRISQWSPAGLSPLFPADFFKVGVIPSLGKSGLRRMEVTPAQYSFLENRCFVLPITSYDRIDPETGDFVRRVRARRRNDCISFRTIAPTMQVELFWDSPDDFDLRVTEPDGDNLDRNNPRTEQGRFGNDNGVDACVSPRTHFEMVTYRRPATLETGQYGVRVTHFRNCGFGRTRYAVRVLIDGVKIFEQFGSSNAMRTRVVDELTFTV